MGLPCVEIHSRKSQPQRDRASAQFRTAKAAILFTSDVTARGLDYPDVTFVVQVGYSQHAHTHNLSLSLSIARARTVSLFWTCSLSQAVG